MKTCDLSKIFESETSYPILTQNADGSNAWVDYGLGKWIWEQELQEIGSFDKLEEDDADQILSNAYPSDRKAIQKGKVYANADRTFITVLYGDYYEVIKQYNGGSEQLVDTYDTKEEAIEELKRYAIIIANKFDAERMEWIESKADLEFLIEDSLNQGSPYMANYQEILDDFTPGLWRTDYTMPPKLIYGKGSDFLRWDTYCYIIKMH